MTTLATMNELADFEIEELCVNHAMITPFINHQENMIEFEGKPKKVPSFGLSSSGYDIRLSNKFMVFDDRFGGIIDPTDFDPRLLREETGPTCIIPPNSYVLASTIERFNMPDNVTAKCMGKSSLARCGIIPMVTPLEVGWSGWLTLEISNETRLPVRLYAGMGIGQLIFTRISTPRFTYRNRATGVGKYQDQPDEPVIAR